MAITDGRYKTRAAGQVVLGTSSEKKTPFIELYVEITEGENKGGRARWTGYFTDKTQERTIQALQLMGWEGEDLSEFADGELHGLDTNEVEAVIELEEYETKEGETRTAPRVAFINRLGGYLNVQNAMSKSDAESFGERMKGLVMRVKAKNPPPVANGAADDPSFNFGANATQKATGTGAKKAW